jgi:hypothetical protein
LKGAPGMAMDCGPLGREPEGAPTCEADPGDRGATEGMDEMFTRYWKASVEWDGRAPIRAFG